MDVRGLDLLCAANCGISVVRSILESHALSWQSRPATCRRRSTRYSIRHRSRSRICFSSQALSPCGSPSDRSVSKSACPPATGRPSASSPLSCLVSPSHATISRACSLRTKSLWPLNRPSSCILSLCAVISVVLRRWAVEMGGGHLARALQFLTAYVTLRSLLVFVTAYFTAGPATPGLTLAIGLGWSAVPWLATLAAVSCAPVHRRCPRARTAARLTNRFVLD